MLSEDSLKRICNTFIGDEENYYIYKKGPQLVSFFNNHFGYRESYGQGFPSRWIFVYNKLVEIKNYGKIDDFFNIILETKFMETEHDCNTIEAAKWSEEAYRFFNKILNKDEYAITHVNNKYHLVQENDDLQLLGCGGFANAYLQKSTGLVKKVLKDDFLTNSGIRSRFKREYNLTKDLNDLSGVIKVYNFDEGSCTYTMECAEITFDKYIQNNDLDLNLKIKCIRIILAIMKDVHERDVIH
jgi:hypothetical protein